jgi:hypothetical protein
MSYNIVDVMVWEGLGDILNTLRKNTLSLQPLDTVTASSILTRLHVPHTYLWLGGYFWPAKKYSNI